MADFDLPDDVRDQARTAWQRYLDVLIPLRPGLFRYCRRLTGNVWDAEDLVQDALLRGFATLGAIHRHIDNPRAYLIRVATNSWIDTVRRRTAEGTVLAAEPPAAEAVGLPAQAAELRDAGAVLMHRLAPQERAAVVLKEVFDMSLAEIAGVLGTTIGAIKAALHRGRERLREAADAPASGRSRPSPVLVDRFVEHLNAADLPGLLALMLDTGAVEELGNVVEVGRAQFSAPGSWLFEAVNVHPELPVEMRPPKFLNERATYDGEPIVISYLMHDGIKFLTAVTRFEEQDGRIARMRAYNFCPDLLQEVAATLGLAAGQVPYRFPTPAPGRYWWEGQPQ